MARVSSFVYGVLCYAVFFAVFLYGVGFIAGVATPTALDGPARVPLPKAMAVDLALLAAFAVQHSGMARPAFKRWWTRIVPEHLERSTYVLLSSLALAAFYLFWQPMGGVFWESHGEARGVILAVYLFGWALLLYTTFLIDHFDLFGLKQVWRRLTRQPYEPPKFHTPSLYKLVRHPLYVGWLTIFWAAPVMSAAHLIFAVMTTAYILIAIRLEERDLAAAFGQTYADYRRRTPMLIPRLWPASAARPAAAPPRPR
ncbi:MAG TPA: isoprenylcysteine carboxylmethyltransferase family protein [Caulobacteraceae bacterium]|nr:isoprenylcysteine carboxylmethyltransferase family protein [Caulobacteraceae bacterium]